MPALEALLPVPSPEPQVEKETPVAPDKHGKGAAKGHKDKMKKGKSTKSSKKKGKNVKGPYGAPDERDCDRRTGAINMSFRTERLKFSKAMKFPAPAIIVQVPDKHFPALRDTLLTRVQLKIVYLQTMAAAKDKKAKKQQGAKKEEILKKITLATFYCDLRMISWKQTCIEYIWSDAPDKRNAAVPVENIPKEPPKGKGQDAHKHDKAGKKGAKKSDKKSEKGSDKRSGKASGGKGKKAGKRGNEPMSCHFGFGLVRSQQEAPLHKNQSVYTL